MPGHKSQRAAWHAAPILTIDQWRSWEIRRFLDSQHPGRHGYFTNDEAD